MSINIILAFFLSLGLSLFTIHSIIAFSVRVGWGDEPGEKRKLHKTRVPNLGGLGIFIATCVTYFSFSDYDLTIRPDKLFSISTFLFFMGIKDDMDGLKPWVRFLIEFICAFFIIFITDIRLVTLWGIFGIQELPIWLSYILTSFFIVGCLNAYNLIDGLDGLLGTLALLVAVCFGLIFEAANEWLWTLLCVAISGSLIGFLFFNWHPARVFMGNGGSLFLGTIIACLSLRVMQLPPITYQNLNIIAPHTIAFSIIAIPLVDMVCVFVLRIAHGLSPFKADNRHIHHRILSVGINHSQVTLILLAVNIVIICFAYFVQPLGALRSIVLTIIFAFALELLTIYLVWQIRMNQKGRRLKRIKRIQKRNSQ